jgi:arginine repressor
MAKAAEAPKSKMQVVKEIVAKGITKNADIIAAAKEQGVSLTPGTVANYKHHLGASKPRKRGRRKGAKKSVKAKVVRATPMAVSSDLELENLALRLIIKAGSVAKARQLIDRVG